MTDSEEVIMDSDESADETFRTAREEMSDSSQDMGDPCHSRSVERRTRKRPRDSGEGEGQARKRRTLVTVEVLKDAQEKDQGILGK